MTILELFMLGLIEDNICPMCLGELDTGYECNKCNYDGAPLLQEADGYDIEG